MVWWTNVTPQNPIKMFKRQFTIKNHRTRRWAPSWACCLQANPTCCRYSRFCLTKAISEKQSGNTPEKNISFLKRVHGSRTRTDLYPLRMIIYGQCLFFVMFVVSLLTTHLLLLGQRRKLPTSTNTRKRKKGRRLDLGWWPHNTMSRWCATELYTWSLHNFISQCHPDKFNKKEKRKRKENFVPFGVNLLKKNLNICIQ